MPPENDEPYVVPTMARGRTAATKAYHLEGKEEEEEEDSVMRFNVGGAVFMTTR